MIKKNWMPVSIQMIKFENEDIITNSVTITPGENETPFLPIS